MRAFSRRGQALQTRLQPNEAAVLQTLTGELVELLGPLAGADDISQLDAIMAGLADSLAGETEAGRPSDDPALRRLFPDAYRDDPAASRDFRRYTQAGQADAKVQAARLVVDDIAAADDGWVTVPPDHIEAWLTTCTNLRLVLAARLGIEHEADAEALAGLPPGDPRTPMAAVYDWCGWMLESLLACL